MARCVGGDTRHAGREQTDRMGAGAHRRDLSSREKRGDGIGLTKRGKGSKCEVIVSGEGVPLAAVNAAASVGETRLVEPLLEQLIDTAQTDEKFWPQRIIGDKAYDSDPLRKVLDSVDIELIAPHRSNRTESRTNDGRRLRRYKRRWKVERFFAWAGSFRRFLTRYERLKTTTDAVVNVACLLIAMKYL
jgi:transposase